MQTVGRRAQENPPGAAATPPAPAGRPSALLDTRIIYCGDCLDQLQKLPNACIDLVYIDPPFNSNRNYEVFWGDPSEPQPQGSGPPIAQSAPHKHQLTAFAPPSRTATPARWS